MFLVKNNKNKVKLSLSQTGNMYEKIEGVKENEIVYFELHSFSKLYEPILWIQDFAIYPSEIIGQGDKGYLYQWRQDAPIFRNHFGHCQITLQYQTNEDSSSFSSISTVVDVFAVKFKAEQAKLMLFYLEDKMNDVVRACFSRTQWNSNSKNEGMSHARAILQMAELCLNQIETNLSSFHHKPVSRLSPKNRLQPANQVELITPSVLEWLVQNPEQFVSPSPLSTSVKVRSQLLGIQEIMGEGLIKDTNTYENQAIKGWMINVTESLQEIRSNYQHLRDTTEINSPRTKIPTNYSSFGEIRRLFGQKLFDTQIEKCDNLLRRYSFCLKFWENYLPTKQTIRYLPDLTPQFSAQPHYSEVFSRMVEWYRLGKLNIDGEKYLFSLRTLDKLYEFYCLFLLIEALQKNSWKLNQSVPKKLPTQTIKHDEWQISPDNDYIFISENDAKHQQVRLQYEPRIKIPKDSKGKLVYAYADFSGRYPYLEPDFVLRLFDGKEYKYIIFDSKYMHPKGARKQLPALMEKYIHKIADRTGGASPVKALFALHPKDINLSYRGVYLHSFYQKPYDIKSDYSIIPTLGTIELTPENHELNRDGLSQRLNEIFDFLETC